MLSNVFCYMIVAIFTLHRGMGETISFFPDDNKRLEENYASNTPFTNELEMESFIRNEWRNYPMVNTSSMIHTLKEVLYATFNPNKTKIRVYKDFPLSNYTKEKLSVAFQPERVYVVTPSLLVPVKYFKWWLELLTMMSDTNAQLHNNMTLAMKTLNGLDKDEDSEVVKLLKNCQADVIVPHLFKSNFCLIGPIIESYLPTLANVSLIKLSNVILRYNSVKNDVFKDIQCEFYYNTLDELKNIPISNDEEISFEDLRIISDNFQKNLSLLYLKTEYNNNAVSQKAVPLSHWAIVYDALHTDVNKYLKLITGENGLKIYENLPLIGYRKNTNDTNMKSFNFSSNTGLAHLLFAGKRKENSTNTTDDNAADMKQNNAFPVPIRMHFPPIGISPKINTSKENHIHQMDQDEETRNDDDEKNTPNEAENNTDNDLDSPIVGQFSPLLIRQQQNPKRILPLSKYQNDAGNGAKSIDLVSNNNQTTDAVSRKSFLLIHHVGRIETDKSTGRNITNHDVNFSIHNPTFMYLSTDTFKTDCDSPLASHKNCINSGKSNWNLETVDGVQPRIRHHVEASPEFKLHGSSKLKNAELKKSSKKTSKLRANHLIKGKKNYKCLTGKSTSLKANISRKSIPISSQYVSSTGINGIQSRTNFEDISLLEELQNTFNPSRT